MIINPNAQSLAKVYGESASVKNSPVNKAISGTECTRRDEVVLSTQAQTFSQVLLKAKNMPEVRQEKVDAIAAEIHAGQYRVDSRMIAEKMLSGRY